MNHNICQSNPNVNLVWLRRDLRLYDHMPISLAGNCNNPFQLIFIFDKKILARFTNKQDRRLSLIAEALVKINRELAQYNGKLLILHGDANTIIPQIINMLNSNIVFAGEDFEPENILRDKEIDAILKQKNISLTLSCDHLIMHPNAVLKDDNTPYKVFTPYSKAWLKKIEKQEAQNYLCNFTNIFNAKNLDILLHINNMQTISSDSPQKLLSEIGYEYVTDNLWHASDAQKTLFNFIDNKINHYKDNRDFIDQNGTSLISPYLRFGLISIRECYNLAKLQPASTTWINELIWREFYAMILYHYPYTINQEFQKQYQAINWDRDPVLFKKFCQGETGFPIIDAAVTELNQTGKIHNRLRMIVASFMTKDLWLDWRMGEEYFAQTLMDYELSSNVGGWQWSASTGTDAQPYFRIFNPWLQASKFDPEANYIKKIMSQLKNIDPKIIHSPNVYKYVANYPNPIIDHTAQAREAITKFKLYRNVAI
jgi:deoxyribodipyrimidine photo-lyase